MQSLRIRARFIVVDADRVMESAEVVINSGRILSVEPQTTMASVVDLGNTALLPGFVNPHTHLEFSDLTEPFAASEHFPDWIRQVVSARREAVSGLSSEALADKRCGAVEAGLHEAFLTGTALIGEIATPPWSVRDCLDHSACEDINSEGQLLRQHLLTTLPQIIVFPELLGLSPDRFGESLRWACNLESRSPLVRTIGCSPHAPYSVHAESLKECLQRSGLPTPVAMHVAESLDELQWIESGEGSFSRMYSEFGIRAPEERLQVAEAITMLNSFSPALLIHGNYVTDGQIEMLSQSQTSVVYCPRTHRHFGHEQYPLEKLLEHGINVCIATDSRASNPDLNLWRDAVTAHRTHPQVGPATIFKMITSNGAQALQASSDFGSIEAGKLAALNAVDLGNLPEVGPGELLEAMLNNEGLKIQPLAIGR